MNKDAILETMITAWCPQDGCFVTRSTITDTITAAGESVEEAERMFREMVEIHHEEYRAGRHALYAQPGRPKKGKVKFNTEIDPEIKAQIAALAKEKHISQGEAVEYFFSFYKAKHA